MIFGPPQAENFWGSTLPPGGYPGDLSGRTIIRVFLAVGPLWPSVGLEAELNFVVNSRITADLEHDKSEFSKDKDLLLR